MSRVMQQNYGTTVVESQFGSTVIDTRRALWFSMESQDGPIDTREPVGDDPFGLGPVTIYAYVTVARRLELARYCHVGCARAAFNAFMAGVKCSSLGDFSWDKDITPPVPGEVPANPAPPEINPWAEEGDF